MVHGRPELIQIHESICQSLTEAEISLFGTGTRKDAPRGVAKALLLRVYTVGLSHNRLFSLRLRQICHIQLETPIQCKVMLVYQCSKDLTYLCHVFPMS
ncbi:hypothetical protein ACQRIU_004204 [Beauveria bassiana]